MKLKKKIFYIFFIKFSEFKYFFKIFENLEIFKFYVLWSKYNFNMDKIYLYFIFLNSKRKIF